MKTVRRSRLKVRYQLVTVTRCTISEIRGAESVSDMSEAMKEPAARAGFKSVGLKCTNADGGSPPNLVCGNDGGI